MSARPILTKPQKVIVGLVVTGAVLIATIGVAGSYAAVRALAERKGFGHFALVFPIGIDIGIGVLLALDLLLTWLRIPFPLLRQTAWLLTIATIAFNAAAAWPDPLAVGMHAVIPVLFVVTVEAARHAVGRIADITADKHMEGVRITRWLLSPLPTFLLWRRMKLWELRSYEQTIRLEQERLIYQARLHSHFGRAWRRKAPIESLMPLRLARHGVPLTETAPSGLAAAGIGSGTAKALNSPGGSQILTAVHSDAHAASGGNAPGALASGFDQAAEDALTLVAAPAPSAPATHLALDAPAPAEGHASTTPAALAHPQPDAPASEEDTTGALVFDLAEMRPVPRDLTADAHPHPHPDAHTRTAPSAAAHRSAPANASDTDEELIQRILERPGPWPLRRMQRELHIGQARAQRIRNALRTRPEPGAPEPDASALAPAEERAPAPAAPASTGRTAS